MQLLISFLKSLEEDINLFEYYALFMCGCFLIQFWLHMYEFDYSSPSLLNEYLWYDKLWGPSQRVVTLFFFPKQGGCHDISYHDISNSCKTQSLAFKRNCSLRQRLKGSNLSSGPSPAIEQTREVERKECQKCYVGMNSVHWTELFRSIIGHFLPEMLRRHE